MVNLLRSIAAKSPGESFVELVCGWFDDLYLPGFDPDDCNPGVHEKGVVEFNSCFHAKELQALELFHRNFIIQVKNIPSEISHQDLATNAQWKVIRHAAAKTLKAFDSLAKEG